MVTFDVSAFDLEQNAEILFMLSPAFRAHPKELTTEMVYAHIARYVRQVKAMAECGFDGVNIHMSYRFFLPARFLSPMTNLRTDEFGGSFEGHTRFCRELCSRITAMRNVVMNTITREEKEHRFLNIPNFRNEEGETLLDILPHGLSEKEVQLLRWRYESIMDYEVMAAKMNVSEATCRARVHRAKEHCKKLLLRGGGCL